MQLAGALFEQIASTLSGQPRPDVSEPAASQRRREPRAQVDAKVTVIPLTDRFAPAPFQISIRDLSPGGIGFVHTDKVGLDEQFVVLLPEGRDSVAVLCQVAYYQPLAEKQYAVGARFVRVLRQPAGEGPATIPLTQPAPIARRAAS